MGTQNVFIPLTSSLNENTPLPTITISAPGYESVEKIPYKGDGTAKEDLGVIKLIPTKDALDIEKIKASQLNSSQIENLQLPQKNIEYFLQKKITDVVINLKGTAIPLVLDLISSFGVTKVSQIVEQKKSDIPNIIENTSCPSSQELSILLNRKNKLVKQLNNAFKTIEKATKTVGINSDLITTFNTSFNILKNLPIPTSTGVPGVPGLPVNVILGIQDSKILIQDSIQKLSSLNSSSLTSLTLLQQTLTQIITYLNLLDKLISHCSPDSFQEQLSPQLTLLTSNQSTQLSPVVTNVNGFEMGVETEITDKPLKRRRAIAKNKQNVIMLKGEWSFSSIDQILIDELVFYIQQNNLKAD